MGLDLEFAHGEGPVIHNPVREAADVDRVVELDDVDALDFVIETVRLTRAGLPDHIPVLGFAGAPFTLASYAIEGGASRSYLHTKTLMYRDTGAWDALMARLARSVTRYLNAQSRRRRTGRATVRQLGRLPGRRTIIAAMCCRTRSAIIAGMPPEVPVINFATGNPALLPLLAEARRRA